MATQFVVILYTDSGPTKNSGYVNDQKKQKKTLVNIMNNISLLYFFYIIATLKSTAHRTACRTAPDKSTTEQLYCHKKVHDCSNTVIDG